MSLGYIGYCKKETEDDTAVIYTYSGADWNNPQRDRSAEMAYDSYGVFPEKEAFIQ
jgi:hypothetical protein